MKDVGSARGNETHDIGGIKALEDLHLAPYALPVALYYILLRNGLQCDLARDINRWRFKGGDTGEEGPGTYHDLSEEATVVPRTLWASFYFVFVCRR